MPPKGKPVMVALDLEPEREASYSVVDKGINLREFNLNQSGLFVGGRRIECELIGADDIDTSKAEIIGRGASGHVEQVIHKPSGKFLALKSIAISTKEHRDEIVKELSVLGKGAGLACPYLVRNYGAYFDSDTSHIKLPMEWMDGTLTSSIAIVNKMWETILRDISWQVLNGLAFLHDMHVIHRDIKPGNILMNVEGYVKVADFGIAKILGTGSAISAGTFVGTQAFMSPERLESDSHDYSSDIWAFGVTMAFCANGENPWKSCVGPGEAITVFSMRACIDSGATPHLPSGPDFSANAHDIVKMCLQAKPSSRPTSRQLLQHPFFAGVTEATSVAEVKKFVVMLGNLQKDNVRKLGALRKQKEDNAMGELDAALIDALNF